MVLKTSQHYLGTGVGLQASAKTGGRQPAGTVNRVQSREYKKRRGKRDKKGPDGSFTGWSC